MKLIEFTRKAGAMKTKKIFKKVKKGDRTSKFYHRNKFSPKFMIQHK